MANAAFYYGLVRALAEAERPVWTQMSFAAAAENLHEAARHGIDARLYWPGLGEVPVAELVLRRLLPLAREGLARGASTRPTPTGCWASSSSAASPAGPARPGRSRRSHGPQRADGAGPRGGAARR